MKEFRKKEVCHFNISSLIFSLVWKYFFIYLCAFHMNPFFKPPLPYDFAYAEAILPSRALHPIWPRYYRNPLLKFQFDCKMYRLLAMISYCSTGVILLKW